MGLISRCGREHRLLPPSYPNRLYPFSWASSSFPQESISCNQALWTASTIELVDWRLPVFSPLPLSPFPPRSKDSRQSTLNKQLPFLCSPSLLVFNYLLQLISQSPSFAWSLIQSFSSLPWSGTSISLNVSFLSRHFSIWVYLPTLNPLHSFTLIEAWSKMTWKRSIRASNFHLHPVSQRLSPLPLGFSPPETNSLYQISLFSLSRVSFTSITPSIKWHQQLLKL